MKTTLSIGMLTFFITTMMYVKKSRDLKQELNKALINNIEVKSNNKVLKRRLKNYMLVSIKLNDACNKFKSSREEIGKDKELNNLLNNLN